MNDRNLGTMLSGKRPQDTMGTPSDPAEKRPVRQSSAATATTFTTRPDYTPVYGGGRRRNPDSHDNTTSNFPSSPAKQRRLVLKSTSTSSNTTTPITTIPTTTIPPPHLVVQHHIHQSLQNHNTSDHHPLVSGIAGSGNMAANLVSAAPPRTTQKRASTSSSSSSSATRARTAINGKGVYVPTAHVHILPTPTTTSTTTSTTTNTLTAALTTAAISTPHSPHAPPPSTVKPKQQRNIEKVMLGNLCFDTWYTSYYSKDLLGDQSGGAKGKGAGGGGKTAVNHASPASSNTATSDQPPDPRAGGYNGGHHCGSSSSGNSKNTPPTTKDDGGAKASGRASSSAVVLERLYVCPCCFKYSKELVTWWAHVRYCQAKAYVPGDKIYVHPKGPNGMNRPPGSATAPPHPGPLFASGGRKGTQAKKAAAAAVAAATATAEEDAREKEEANEGEYSIWEVDGEKDTLFCQNLSLFAKLFLETKSVFYDVTGFKYYLLVFTAPEEAQADIKHRILGFFSKEKVSWDNNNLACILVFPPSQKKGFGNLLMGVSYEISRREKVIGGPEKPISELGKKGYRRYWGGEIARWIQKLEPDENGEMIFDVDECSRATWIAPEDCASVLRDMGVVDCGMGPPKAKKKQSRLLGEEGEEGEEGDEDEDKENDELVLMEDAGAEEDEVREVRRVKMDKSRIRRWVVQNRISLERPCDPNGFVPGYIQLSVEVD